LKRKKLLDDALSAHIEGKWGLTIYALVPQIEAIMREWLKEGPLKNQNLPVHQKDIALKFSEFAKKKVGSFKYGHLAESSTNFILGPVLTKIEEWKKLYGPDVPNAYSGRT
jgi:hypothetical protein